MTKRSRFPDQEPPAKYPERCLVVRPDVFSEEGAVMVMVLNKRGDISRGVTLSREDAREMAEMLLSFTAPASAQAEQPTEAQP